MPNCPDCNSQQTVKNGHIHNGKPCFRCKDCHRQFVVYPTQKRNSCQTKAVIDKLLLEKISLHGIVRVTSVSLSWLQNYVNKKYQRIEKKVQVCPKRKCRLTIECDEMWSFVQSKKNKQWIWLAIDRETKEIVGPCHSPRSSLITSALSGNSSINITYHYMHNTTELCKCGLHHRLQKFLSPHLWKMVLPPGDRWKGLVSSRIVYQPRGSHRNDFICEGLFNI